MFGHGLRNKIPNEGYYLENGIGPSGPQGPQALRPQRLSAQRGCARARSFLGARAVKCCRLNLTQHGETYQVQT